jgi:hypothetical protein
VAFEAQRACHHIINIGSARFLSWRDQGMEGPSMDRCFFCAHRHAHGVNLSKLYKNEKLMAKIHI